MPIGCNIESVSVRKVEIDAALHLVGAVRGMIQTGGSALGS
jgi:hypothetical protein